MNSKLLIPALLVLVIIASGCITGEETYSPKATLELSVTQPLEIADGEYSELITATVTKQDSEGVSTVFTIHFEDYNPNYIKMVDPETKEKIIFMETDPLTEKGREDTSQFLIHGKKIDLQPESPWTVTVRLVHNGTIIDSETQVMNIIVK